MKVIDLTHKISENMPVYPGTEGPKLKTVNTYEKDGFKETLMTMYSHTGTHMDPPAHLYDGGTTLDRFDISHFAGNALTVDCRMLSAGDRITFDMIDKDKAEEADYLLFNTGWSRYWGKEEYFGEYPYVTDEVIDYIRERNKKGIGLDTIGLDPIADINLTLHKRLFENHDVVVIENLTNLNALTGKLCTFLCLPLKYENADGSPIRAIAITK